MPLNQFILGGDSMFSNNLDDIDTQIQRMELYRQRLKQLKSKIIDDTNREMQLFKKFQEYSKSHTGITYEEFLKENV